MVVTACYYDADRLKARSDLSPVSACQCCVPTANPAGTRSGGLPPVSVPVPTAAQGGAGEATS
jgi:hypothetical protein